MALMQHSRSLVSKLSWRGGINVAENEKISVMSLLITDYNKKKNYWTSILTFSLHREPWPRQQHEKWLQQLVKLCKKKISVNAYFLSFGSSSPLCESSMFCWLIHPDPSPPMTSFSASHHNYDGPQALSLELNTSCFGGSCWNAAFFLEGLN